MDNTHLGLLVASIGITLFVGWPRQAAAVSALFILVNSIAGLFGYFRSGRAIPSLAWMLAVAAIAGGAMGSYLGICVHRVAAFST